MSQRIECPSCGRGLIVSESVRGEQLTCPRCLAAVDVPAPRNDRDEIDADRRDSGLSCPRCHRDVQAIWVACPWCEEPLRGRDPHGYGRPDLDVRRDRKRTGVVVILLAILGGIAVAGMSAQAFALFAQAQGLEAMIYLAVGLLFLAALSTLIVFVRSKGNPGADGFRRVAVGTLAMVGALMVFGTCAGLSVFIFLLAVCLTGNGPHF